MPDVDQQTRLRQFWGAAIFSLGVLWGFSNLVYVPVAVLTTLRGSSWLEVFVVLAGGLLIFFGSIGAFYRRKLASALLLAGGILLLATAVLGQRLVRVTATGEVNLLLLLLPGITAMLFGLFGLATERKQWPPLRRSR